MRRWKLGFIVAAIEVSSDFPRVILLEANLCRSLVRCNNPVPSNFSVLILMLPMKLSSCMLTSKEEKFAATLTFDSHFVLLLDPEAKVLVFGLQGLSGISSLGDAFFRRR